MKIKNSQKRSIWVSLFFLLPFALAACAQTGPEPVVEVSIAWSEIDQGVGLKVGDTLEIVLPVNSSTGELWVVGFYNQSVLKPVGAPQFSASSFTRDTEDSQIVHFEAIGEGVTELVLDCRQSSDYEEQDGRTFKVFVTVR